MFKEMAEVSGYQVITALDCGKNIRLIREAKQVSKLIQNLLCKAHSIHPFEIRALMQAPMQNSLGLVMEKADVKYHVLSLNLLLQIMCLHRCSSSLPPFTDTSNKVTC